MPEKVEKANAIGSMISVWGKILIGLFVFIVSVGTAWYQIQTNASENVRQDGQFKEVMETMTREFEIQGQRSDKRYQRAMDEADELHNHDHELETFIHNNSKEILEIYKELYYLKGVAEKK